MASVNKVFVMGNLARDPEMRYTPKGLAICSFGLAVNRKWKDQSGEQREEVDFIDCTAFGRQAEVIGEYMRKGSAMHIEGRLKQSNWEDKQTGNKRSKLGVVVEGMQFIGGKRDDGQQSKQRQPTAREQVNAAGKQADGNPYGDDDVPF